MRRALRHFGILVIAAQLSAVTAAPIKVRFAEGLTRGYLALRDVEGKVIAQGDLVQVAHGERLEKRMTFHFKDGSLFDERVTYTGNGVFRLESYELSQRGPAFEDDREVSLKTATGAYRVKTKDRKDGKEEIDEGKLELPNDVYNGMLMTIVKYIPKGGATISYVAFSPDARVIELEYIPSGEQKISVGELEQTAVHYVIKPRLGFWLKVFAKVTGRSPEDLHAWVATGEVPAFVGFQGPFNTSGPTWRVEVVSPQLVR